MRSDMERVLPIVAIVVSLLCGAYIGHENTLDALRAQPQQEQCTDTER